MTIDLGFAHIDVPFGTDGTAGANGVFRVGLVDVPGHADFVRNMVAGVGSIDAAILIVAADDGWMPPTLSRTGIQQPTSGLTGLNSGVGVVEDVGAG